MIGSISEVAPVLRYPGGKRKYEAPIHEGLTGGRRPPRRLYSGFFGSGAVEVSMLARYPALTVIAGDLAMGPTLLHALLADGYAESITAGLHSLDVQLEQCLTRGARNRLYMAQRHLFNAEMVGLVRRTPHGMLCGGTPEDVGTAVRTAFLSAINFNGLWRVNRAGEYNVPLGDRTRIPEDMFSAIRTWDRLLRNGARLRLEYQPWRATLDAAIQYVRAKPQEAAHVVVYLDPPYAAPDGKTFTAYAGKGSFTYAALGDLIMAAEYLVARGVRVVISQGTESIGDFDPSIWDRQVIWSYTGISRGTEKGRAEVIYVSK